MWVPASDSCVTLTLDIDTTATATTRSWNVKVTQYECGNLMAPEESCLQYHTATAGYKTVICLPLNRIDRQNQLVIHQWQAPSSSFLGTIASFNWDTSTESAVQTDIQKNFHLADQYYDICIRRTRNYCSVCFSPQIAATTGSSFGLSANNGPADTLLSSSTGLECSGLTTNNAAPTAVGKGDFLTILNLQPSIGTSGAIGVEKICGVVFSADASKTGAAAITTAVVETVCSYKIPFRVGVHFDEAEAIAAPGVAAAPAVLWGNVEDATVTGSATGEGIGYSGFWLAYWQNSCWINYFISLFIISIIVYVSALFSLNPWLHSIIICCKSLHNINHTTSYDMLLTLMISIHKKGDFIPCSVIIGYKGLAKKI